MLELDRSSLEDFESEDAAAAVVRTIVELADAMDLTVVAEGVETAARAAALDGTGGDSLEGFLFARAMPSADALALPRAPAPS